LLTLINPNKLSTEIARHIPEGDTGNEVIPPFIPERLLKINDWVAIAHKKTWNAGFVEAVLDNRIVRVNFLQNVGKNRFRFHVASTHKNDIDETTILYKLSAPHSCGKTRNIYSFPSCEYEHMDSLLS
jgi:hypothetical protein